MNAKLGMRKLFINNNKGTMLISEDLFVTLFDIPEIYTIM